MDRSLALALAGPLSGQDGQRRAPAEWPCVPGRAVDPAYLETSESTGGQIFLLQRDEAVHTPLVLSATARRQTVLRSVGHLLWRAGVRVSDRFHGRERNGIGLASVRPVDRRLRPAGRRMDEGK